MKITVYTMEKCPNCPRAKTVCKDAAKELGVEFEEKDLKENVIEALQLQIASTPTIVYGEDVLFRSDVPNKNELIEAIKQRGDTDDQDQL